MSLMTNGKNMSDSPIEFWDEPQAVKDGNNETKFEFLGTFMCNLLVLLHSSACVNRVFLQVNVIKTAATLANRLLAKQAIACEGTVCHTWEPSKKLIEDVRCGYCRRRYLEKLGAQKEEDVIHVYDVNVMPDEYDDI